MANPALRALALLVVASCGGEDTTIPDHGAPPALSAPLLSFDPAAAAAANTAALPPGFSGPMETVCATDTTRGFLVELFENGIQNPQVPYEWAPMAPGPDATRPTIAQPELFIAGQVTQLERSNSDFRPSHPFGFDTTWDMNVDAPFLGMVHNRAGDDQSHIHCEIESGLYPDAAFGLAPAKDDRVLLKGAWIFDCGHPPYEAELHPPTFFALARADGAATVSLAFANPYRSTQLYGPAALGVSFDDATRFTAPGVAAFTGTLLAQIVQAATGQVMQFQLHELIEPTRFEPLTWFVCAPGSRPSPSSTLGWSYRFVARTGVSITAATRGDSGCLELHAEQSAAYRPVVPVRRDYSWPWDQISREASAQIGFTIDIREQVISVLDSLGFSGDIPALRTDTPIILDEYPALAPRAGAASDAPTEIVDGADDQPFPFYGRVRVFWR